MKIRIIKHLKNDKKVNKIDELGFQDTLLIKTKSPILI